jgi:PKD repeat protein
VVNGKTYTLSIVNDGGACTITNNEVYGCTSSNKVTMPPTNCYAYTDSISAFGKTYYFDKINCVPVVAFTMSSTEDSEGSLIVNVDASPSNNDGDIVNYEWTTSTGQNATGKTASLVFNEAGTHTITLKITDDEGKTASLQTTLVVNLNSPPQALFTTSVTEGTIPLTVNLDASTSNDDDSITDHAWLTSTGQIASGQTATVTFNDVGTHTITLTVTDNLGKTASLEKNSCSHPKADSISCRQLSY